MNAVPQIGIFATTPVNSPLRPSTVTLGPALALVVSNMIGTGVFMSLGFQVSGFAPNGVSLLHGGVFPIVMLWVVGGVLALCGALCYAELATALPRSGGEYYFLSRIYHPIIGFCTGLCSATVGFAAPAAASALLFGDYLCRAFPAVQILGATLSPHLLAILLVTGLTLAHLYSLQATGTFQAVATGATVLLILTFVAVGFSTGPVQAVHFTPQPGDFNLLFSKYFGSSLIWVMYSYSGWNAAAYIVEEIRDPARSLPRALILGTLFVLGLYVAVNCVFLYTTPLAALSGAPEVAHIAGVQIFGPIGARIGSALISVGLVANVSAMIWVGSRVSQAIGATYPALGLLGRTNARRVPTVALLCQFGIIFFLLFLDPNKIIHYVESVLLFWSLLAVLGVIVLRWREPHLVRPYRTLAYPFTPLIFAVVTIFCLVKNCQIYPSESAIGAATVLIGIPLYAWARRDAAPARLPGALTPGAST